MRFTWKKICYTVAETGLVSIGIWLSGFGIIRGFKAIVERVKSYLILKLIRIVQDCLKFTMCSKDLIRAFTAFAGIRFFGRGVKV